MGQVFINEQNHTRIYYVCQLPVVKQTTNNIWNKAPGQRPGAES